MKAAVVTRLGRPEILVLREDSEPGEGQVKIRVAAAGIHFADSLARMGLDRERRIMSFLGREFLLSIVALR